MQKKDIDVVIAWVDAGDPAWRKEKNYYAALEKRMDLVDNSEVRYRDWDTVRFVLRGIDQYMPWVRTVHFITWGHLPKWMNPEAERLHIVNHKDYIPSEYLPTFCSHVIELNMHRIPGLADQFVYFNDDMLIMQPTKPEDFFKNGLPRDYAVLNPLISSHRYAISDISLMDIEIINDHFKKNDVIKKNFFKWITPVYGKNLFRSLCLMPWPKFSALLTKHQCCYYLKETFDEVWEKEFEVLDSTCRHRFRTKRDVNQWLFRYWQLAEGKFVPTKPRGLLYGIQNDNTVLYNALRNSKERFICINDNGAEEVEDFEKCRDELISVLESRFPKKSVFEK